jgi:hypothetical protein
MLECLIARVEIVPGVILLLSTAGKYGEQDHFPSQAQRSHQMDERTVKAV